MILNKSYQISLKENTSYPPCMEPKTAVKFLKFILLIFLATALIGCIGSQNFVGNNESSSLQKQFVPAQEASNDTILEGQDQINQTNTALVDEEKQMNQSNNTTSEQTGINQPDNTTNQTNNTPDQTTNQTTNAGDSDIKKRTTDQPTDIILTENPTTNQTLTCQTYLKLDVGNPQEVNDLNMTFNLESMDADSQIKTARIRIEGTNQNAVIEIVQGNESSIKLNDMGLLLQMGMIRSDYLMLCINTEEKYDEMFCAKKQAAERNMCFDNLGYLNGLDYCARIENPDDRIMCEKGAKGENG